MITRYIPKVKGSFFSKTRFLKLFSETCFGSWFREESASYDFKCNVQTIIYHVPLDKSIKFNKVKAYIYNLQKLCGIKLEYIFYKDKIVFLIPARNRHKFFILTAVRYLSEFPEIINKLKLTYKSCKEFYQDFFRIHQKIKLYKYDNIYGHGLVNLYSVLSNVVSIRKKIKGKYIYSAQQMLCG